MQNQSTLDEMRAGNQDTEDARDNNNKHRATLYFAMAVSVLVIICFYLCIYWIANHPPDPTDHDILYMLFGVGSTAFGAVINYWLGASIQNGLKPQ